MHTKLRLGANEDEKKKKLLKDSRVALLRKIPVSTFSPARSSSTWKTALLALRSAFQRTRNLSTRIRRVQNVSSSRLLRQPRLGAIGRPATTAIDEDLDRIEEEWTGTLLDNLANPAVKKSTEALTAKQKKKAQSLLEKKALPADVSSDFVQILQHVLQGLERITLTTAPHLRILSARVECHPRCPT